MTDREAAAAAAEAYDKAIAAADEAYDGA